MDIKFRYVIKKKDGSTRFEYHTISSLERGNVQWIYLKSQQWTVVSRDRFTGLTDKNCVEIYEGDIMSGTDAFGRLFAGTVAYEPGVYYIHCDDQSRPLRLSGEITVVGNIHEESSDE